EWPDAERPSRRTAAGAAGGSWAGRCHVAGHRPAAAAYPADVPGFGDGRSGVLSVFSLWGSHAGDTRRAGAYLAGMGHDAAVLAAPAGTAGPATANAARRG